MYNIIIFPIIFLFFNTSTLTQNNVSDFVESDFEVYLIKQYWHTAIVIHTEDIDGEKFKFKKYFDGSILIDFGWGDELFYQTPDFDLMLGARAILKPTSSTLRIEGISLPKEKFFEYSEIVVRLPVSREQLDKILNFIEDTFIKENNEYVVLNSIANKIFFFKSKGNYHLFNTCNTWLAKCLSQAGFEISTNIILTEQLFREVLRSGELITLERKDNPNNSGK